jgi:hypothetical protein
MMKCPGCGLASGLREIIYGLPDVSFDEYWWGAAGVVNLMTGSSCTRYLQFTSKEPKI